MSATSTKVFVFEVMGRHAGWIAAAGGLASIQDCPLPIVILFPEVPFEQQSFLAKVKQTVEGNGYCSVVVAEGVKTKDGRFLADAGYTDAFGHTQLGGVAPVVARMIYGELGFRYHWAVSDYLQRSARHLASRTDVEHAYAVGRAAVEMALTGANAIMPTIVRLSDDPYRWEIGSAPLDQIANKEKKMPLGFISNDGCGITELCRRYLLPLIQGEDYPPYEGKLPRCVKLRNLELPKKLNAPP